MLIGAGVVVSIAAGCGQDTLDAGKVEDYVRDQARVPQVIDEVVCPEDRDAKQGDTFECRIALTTGGEEVTTIRQEDDDGTIRIVAHRQTKLPPDASAVRIIPENVEDYIRANAARPERILSVDCPADVRLKKGDTFDCLVRFLDGGSRRVEVTQVDSLGNVKLTGAG